MMPIDPYENRAWKKLKRNRLAFAGLMVIVFACLLAIFGYLVAPDNSPNADLQTVEIQAKKPGYTQLFLKIPVQKQSPSLLSLVFTGSVPGYSYVPIRAYNISGNIITVDKFIDEDTTVLQQYNMGQLGKVDNVQQHFETKTFWLGTDAFGRDILSRLIIGSRVSLTVGLVAVIISLSLGIFLGSIAGYYRGKADAMIMWFVNITWSIPTLLLVFAFTMALGKGFWQILVSITLPVASANPAGMKGAA